MFICLYVYGLADFYYKKFNFLSDNEYMFVKKVFPVLFTFFMLFTSCAEKVSLKVFDSDSVDISSVKAKSGDVITLGFRLKDLKVSVSGQFSLRLNLKKNDKGKIKSGKFVFGILSDSDFGNLDKLSSRPNISGDFSDFDKNSISISMVCDSIPDGFFFQSFGNISIQSVSFEDVQLGFDFDSVVPCFDFSSKGGKIMPQADFDKSIDLSGIKINRNMNIVSKFSDESDSTGKVASIISINKEKFYIRKSNPNQKNETISIPIDAVRNPSGIFSVIENKNQISSMKILYSEPVQDNVVKSGNKKFYINPIKTDPGLVMWWPKKNWRGDDYELFEWDRFSGIIVMDIANYSIQDDFFRRIAFFVEKAGYRGKLYSDEFLDGKHGYNAHDYRAESLAEFYETARNQKFKLNEKEYLLEEILIENGVLKKERDGKVVAGKGAVISISQESPMYLRTQFIAHEGWHGLFFVDEDFRNYVAKLYATLDYGTKRYLIRYFQVTPSLNYDIEDEYLVLNEFMAYMLQKPVGEISKYFIDMASRQHSQEMAKKEADYVLANKAKYFVEASKNLDEYVNRRWNLNAGRVWCVN